MLEVLGDALGPSDFSLLFGDGRAGPHQLQWDGVLVIQELEDQLDFELAQVPRIERRDEVVDFIGVQHSSVGRHEEVRVL